MVPEKAVEVLGRWEDWQWDEEWGEWFVSVPDEGEEFGWEGSGCFMYAGRWRRVGDGGGWEYVGSR